MKNLTRPRPLGYRLLAFMTLLTATLAMPSSATSQAREAPGATQKPVIAIMDFDNSAMIRRDDFSGLTIGVPAFLSFAMSTNPNIEIVERQRVQQVLSEQGLSAAGRVDSTTIIQIGKLLGARYLLFGAFIVEPDMDMRLGVRAVDSQTGKQLYAETVNGKGDQVLKAIDQMAAKLNAGLKLPGERNAKAVKDQGFDGPNQMEIAKAMGAADRLRAKGDLKGAIAMLEKALTLNPGLTAVRAQLASMERAPK
jgi:TolB-like protein